jgi:hypothetical protein
MGQNGPRPAGPGQLSQAIFGSICAPFDLAASQTIYSPLDKSHA